MSLNQVCYRTLGHDKPWSLEVYKSLGGYSVWEKILKEKIALLSEIPPFQAMVCGFKRYSETFEKCSMLLKVKPPA